MWILVLASLIGTITAQLPPECEAATRPLDINVVNTIIRTPGYTGTEPHADNLICEWRINNPTGLDVALDFATNFMIEDCIDCQCDSVKIYDGTDDTGELIGNHCGSISPDVVVGGNTIFVRFVSDSSTNGIGFQAQVIFGDAACGLGGKVLTSPGTFTSPQYDGSSDYPGGADCWWTLRAPEGQRVVMTFTDFNLEQGCQFLGITFDHLDIFQSIDSRQIANLHSEWSNGIRDVLFKNHEGNEVEVNFVSDASVHSSGFSADFWFE